MGRTVSVGDTRLTVSNARVKNAVRSPGVHDPVVRTDAGQYVVVDVTVDGTAPDGLDDGLRASVDGAVLPDSTAIPTVTEGEYAVPFPAASHESAAVGWQTDGGSAFWTLPATVRSRLPDVPRFRVRDVALPVRDGRRVLELTVENTGDRDGQFVAEVSMEGFSGNAIIDFPVPTGESRTYTGRAGKILLYFENNGGGTLVVQYPGENSVSRIEHTRELAETATTSERALSAGTVGPRR